MKRILITGASGFIGQNLLSYWKHSGEIKNEQVVLLTSRNNPDHIVIPHRNYNFTKEDFMRAGIDSIDIVLHLGAFIPKSAAEADNIENTSLNILNTQHLLNNLPSVPEKIIFISTVDVYAPGDGPITEKSLEGPSTLYGWSKLYCEKIILAWCKMNSVIPQILRLGHIYGKGEDDYKKLIPETIKKVIRKEDPVIYSNGQERRSFLHVFDCIRAITRSLWLKEYSGPINVASSHSVSISEVVDLILSIAGNNNSVSILGSTKQGKDYIFDNSRMENLLVKEERQLEKGLLEEYEYFKNKLG